jgi:branched-chain amino acid transport system substrate-binding protein
MHKSILKLIRTTLLGTLACLSLVLLVACAKPPSCGDAETLDLAHALLIKDVTKELGTIAKDDPDGWMRKYLDSVKTEFSSIVSEGYNSDAKKQSCRAVLKVSSVSGEVASDVNLDYDTQLTEDKDSRFNLGMIGLQPPTQLLAEQARSYYNAHRWTGEWRGTYTCQGIDGAESGPQGPFKQQVALVVKGDEGHMERTTQGGGIEKMGGNFMPDKNGDIRLSMGGPGENSLEDKWIAEFEGLVQGDRANIGGVIRLGKNSPQDEPRVLRECELDLILNVSPSKALAVSPNPSPNSGPSPVAAIKTSVSAVPVPAPIAASVESVPPLVIRIGHAAPLSGDWAHLGSDNELGARMAIDELNARHLKIGDRPATFELVAVDDKSDPGTAMAVAQELVKARVSAVVGHMQSGTSIAASKIYSEAGIPEISPSATNPRFTQQGFKTAFRLSGSDEQMAVMLAKYAVQTLKAQRIAVINEGSSYGTGLVMTFREAVTKAGGSIVGDMALPYENRTAPHLLWDITAAKPDLVFFGGMDATAGPLLRMMKEAGMTARFIGGDGMCTDALPKVAGNALGQDAVVCAEAGGATPEFAQGLKDFEARFKAKNGVGVQIYAPYVYDAVNVLADAMVRAGSADPVKYLPALAQTDFKGVTGPISFDARGDLQRPAFSLYTFRGGRKEPLAVLRQPSKS